MQKDKYTNLLSILGSSLEKDLSELSGQMEQMGRRMAGFSFQTPEISRHGAELIAAAWVINEWIDEIHKSINKIPILSEKFQTIEITRALSKHDSISFAP